ncbi:MAG TPA: hypothetical protein VGX76_15730 [Pirellulales bacterium]|jgi:hypothetical protein|nr:hypothetical protein [Pirellulales bacterium]
MLYVANDTNLEVLGLKDEDGNWITNAALTCVVTDPLGNTVANVTLSYRGAGVAVTVGGVTYLDGNYRGLLAGNNAPALVAGSTYREHYAASNYNFAVDKYEVAQVRIA